jgi:hypothetical protein
MQYCNPCTNSLMFIQIPKTVSSRSSANVTRNYNCNDPTRCKEDLVTYLLFGHVVWPTTTTRGHCVSSIQTFKSHRQTLKSGFFIQLLLAIWQLVRCYKALSSQLRLPLKSSRFWPCLTDYCTSKYEMPHGVINDPSIYQQHQTLSYYL